MRRMDPAGSAAAAAHAEEVREREEQEVERDDPERLAQTRAMDEYKDGAHSALVLSPLGSLSSRISISTRILPSSVLVPCSAPAGRGEQVSPRLTPSLSFYSTLIYIYDSTKATNILDPPIVHTEHTIFIGLPYTDLRSVLLSIFVQRYFTHSSSLNSQTVFALIGSKATVL